MPHSSKLFITDLHRMCRYSDALIGDTYIGKPVSWTCSSQAALCPQEAPPDCPRPLARLQSSVSTISEIRQESNQGRSLTYRTLTYRLTSVLSIWLWRNPLGRAGCNLVLPLWRCLCCSWSGSPGAIHSRYTSVRY